MDDNYRCCFTKMAMNISNFQADSIKQENPRKNEEDKIYCNYRTQQLKSSM